MKHLLSSVDGLRALDTLCESRALFAFDFDGTLAPIVARRAAAEISAATLRLLRRLSALAPVVVVSGRSLQDLRSRLHLRAAYLIGNHGIERPASTPAALRDARAHSTRWNHALRETLRPHSRHIDIENKRYSLAIHYRAAQDRAAMRRAILRATRALTPAPRIVPGKFVINLLPPGTPDKGQALRQLMRDTSMQRMLFVGDDATDEAVFALRDRRVVSVRVGRSATSRARYYLRTQNDINFVLEYLVQRLHLKTTTRTK